MNKGKQNIEIKNRKAFHEYEIIDSYEAGIQLKGTEVKALRAGKASMSDSFCYFEQGELWVHKLHISPYSKGNIENHEPKRKRKLLLRKKQLDRISKKVKQRGFTIVPLRLYFGESGYAKLEIALAKGKKVHDKKETLKRKDMERQMERELKQWKQ